jgi:AraC-like DNA-binding protein
VNVIASTVPIVVFPHLPVLIRHAGCERVLATPNLVMLYDPGQPYERERRSARGDEAFVIQLGAPAVEALERVCPAFRDGRVAQPFLPSQRGAYLQHFLLGRYLRDGGTDPLVVEEAAVRIVRAVLETPAAVRPPRTATRHAHRLLAEAAKELIAADVARSPSLRDLAARLGASPFHLARVFRRETGFSLHEYRTQLRLRLALQRLPESGGRLTALALEHGFASHSHFTDTFRREFGVAPSAVRRGADVRRLLNAA